MDTSHGPKGGPAGYSLFRAWHRLGRGERPYADSKGRLCVRASVHRRANTVEMFARGLNPNPDQ
jgi:hypothetical protein